MNDVNWFDITKNLYATYDMRHALVKNYLTNWRERLVSDSSWWRLLHIYSLSTLNLIIFALNFNSQAKSRLKQRIASIKRVELLMHCYECCSKSNFTSILKSRSWRIFSITLVTASIVEIVKIFIFWSIVSISSRKLSEFKKNLKSRSSIWKKSTTNRICNSSIWKSRFRKKSSARLASSISKWLVFQNSKIFFQRREKEVITHIDDRMILQYF